MTAPLPRLLTPLIGRDEELDQIQAWLHRERLVSLVGAGGIGKTRLAVETARRMEREVCFVDLAAAPGPDAVVTSIAAALGISEGGGRAIQDVVVGALAEADMVLVLDNCEHVVAACAAFVEHLLSSCEHMRVLATSRETLGVAGEVAWRVPSLAVPPATADDASSFHAVELFVDRARRVRPSIVVTDAFLAAAAEICRRLDGIALAIELAAAAVRVMPPDHIVDQLDRRFAVLTGGPRTAVSRQQTLQASVEWSYEQLTPIEQQVFRRLGVFTGAFPLAAAEAVAADDGVSGWAVFDVLTRLVDKSLVTHDDDTGWYRLLETLRLFAIDRANAAGELVAGRDLHARWWHEWLLGLGPHWFSDRALDAIDQAYPNLRLALPWLSRIEPDAAHDVVDALSAYWYGSGLFTDALGLSDDLMAGSRRERPVRWARTTAALLSIYDVTRREQVTDLSESAVAIARQAGDELSVVRCEAGDVRAGVDPGGLMELVGRAQDAGDLYLAARIRHTVAGWECIAGGRPWTWINADPAPDDLLIRSVNRSYLHRCRERCVAGDYRGAWALQKEAMNSGGRWTQFTLLFTLLDGVWLPLLLGEHEAMERACATVRTWRRDWGRQQPVASLLARLPALLGGDAPSPDMRGLWESAYSVVLGFPSWHWLFFEVIGPPPKTRPLASFPTINDALEASRLFVGREDGAAEPHLAHAVGWEREDRHLWLLMMACVVATGGGHARAARLFGAVEGFQQSSGVQWVPTVLRDRRAEALGLCESALGPSETGRLLAEGAAMTLAEAAAYSARARGGRGRPTSGWESLTPTERQVVDKVVAGLTNAQIASVLFMSAATVKTHLTHVYAKLAVGNRTELATLAAGRGEP